MNCILVGKLPDIPEGMDNPGNPTSELPSANTSAISPNNGLFIASSSFSAIDGVEGATMASYFLNILSKSSLINCLTFSDCL